MNALDSKKIDQFNNWLSEYQDDLNKIVGKYRLTYHALEHDEVISEINLGILKSYGKILSDPSRAINSQLEFNKMAYSYARNYIKWTADGVSQKDKKYIEKRSDGTVDIDGEEKTVFESVCETIGIDDEFFQSLSESDKFQNLLSWIFDYSHFLSPNQKNILELILSGKNFDQIGDLLGVTHQAISFASIEMFNRIKNHVKVNINDSESDKLKIKKGISAINNLFGEERSRPKLSPQDAQLIKSTLINNPSEYTLYDLENLINRRSNWRQICVFTNRNKMHPFLKKIGKHKKICKK